MLNFFTALDKQSYKWYTNYVYEKGCDGDSKHTIRAKASRGG